MEPKRILVMGGPGQGKSTLGSILSRLLAKRNQKSGDSRDVNLLHMDDVFWLRNWQMLPKSKVRAIVSDFIQDDEWVIDGNYSMSRDLVLTRCTTIIILRLPLPIVLWRLFWREFGRLYGFSLIKYSRPPKQVVVRQKEGFWQSFKILGEQTIRWYFTDYKEKLHEVTRKTSDVEIMLIQSSKQLNNLLSLLSS